MPSSGRSRYRACSAEGGVERPLPLEFCINEGLLLAVLCHTQLRRGDWSFAAVNGSFVAGTGLPCFSDIPFL
jgi:hypothetical protein